MSLTESVADPKFFAWQDKPDNFKMTQIGTLELKPHIISGSVKI